MLALYRQGWLCGRISRKFGRSRKVTYEKVMAMLAKLPAPPPPHPENPTALPSTRAFWTPPRSRLMAGR